MYRASFIGLGPINVQIPENRNKKELESDWFIFLFFDQSSSNSFLFIIGLLIPGFTGKNIFNYRALNWQDTNGRFVALSGACFFLIFKRVSNTDDTISGFSTYYAVHKNQTAIFSYQASILTLTQYMKRFFGRFKRERERCQQDILGNCAIEAHVQCISSGAYLVDWSMGFPAQKIFGDVNDFVLSGTSSKGFQSSTSAGILSSVPPFPSFGRYKQAFCDVTYGISFLHLLFIFYVRVLTRNSLL